MTVSRADKKRSRPIGELIKQHRKARDISLETLSARTGITVSTLSRLENGRIGATFDRITQIAAGLNVPVPELFSAAAGKRGPEQSRRVISRAAERSLTSSSHYEYASLCWELKNQAMFPVIARVLHRRLEDFGSLVTHEGEEFLYVLRGRVRLVTNEYEDTLLEAGDAIYIDSTLAHAILDASDDEHTEILGCATVKRPPE